MSIEDTLSKIEQHLATLVALASKEGSIIAPIVTELKFTPKAEPKAETKKVESKAEPEKTVAEPEQTDDTALAVSRDDLAVKVRALAAIDRPAAAALIKSFGVERLDKLDPSQYIAFDLAIAKALVKAKAGQEG